MICLGFIGCGGGGVPSASTPAQPATVTAVTVTASSSSVVAGKTLQLSAKALYSDNTIQDVSGTATWQSSNPGTATVNSTGLLSGLTTGSTMVTATMGTTSGTMPFTVTAAALSSIQIAPSSVSLAAGQTIQLQATGVFGDGTSQNVTSLVTWSSNNLAAATVDASGLVTAVTAGQATITAASGSVSATASITVTALSLTSITVTPASTSLDAGATQQYAASGVFSDGSSADLTNSVVWASGTTGVATISSSGMVTAVSAGTSSISATSGAVMGSTPLTVTPAALQAIDISPDTASIPVGGQTQFTVVGDFSDGTTQNLTGATYKSSNPAIATVDPTTGVAIGMAANANPVTITVSYGGFTDTAALTVLSPTLVSLAIAPPSTLITVGHYDAVLANRHLQRWQRRDINRRCKLELVGPRNRRSG